MASEKQTHAPAPSPTTNSSNSSSPTLNSGANSPRGQDSKQMFASPVVKDLPERYDPRKWSRAKRWLIALVVWNLVAPIDMGSTFYGGAQDQIRAHFGVSHFVSTLGVGLFNFGFAVGPLIGAPLSELFGRRLVYIGIGTGFTAFALGAALSHNIATLLITRFLCGFFGAPVFSNWGGTLADIFAPEERSGWVALFTLVLQGAPTIGPVPSNYMGAAVNWRWLLGLLAIWGAACTVMIALLPETEPKTIKRRLHAKGHDVGHVDPRPGIKELFSKAMLTPLIMLLLEPIVLFSSLYHAFVYALLFILLEAYPFIYQKTYNFGTGATGLVFLAPWLGNVLGVVVYFGYLAPRYTRRLIAIRETHGPNAKLAPESRLPGVLFASMLVPIGLFWLAGAASPGVHWIAPVLSGVPIGAGMTLLQLSLSNYYIDLYPTRSASALAANVTMRNLFSSVFPSVATPLYHALGIRNATLLLAGISCVGVPAGFLLLVSGKRIRARSRWALKDDEPAAGAVTEKTTDVAAEMGEKPAERTGEPQPTPPRL